MKDILQLPRDYDRCEIERFWKKRPVTVACRFISITAELAPILWEYIRDFRLFPFDEMTTTTSTTNDEYLTLQRLYASNVRLALTSLGPAFVKIGQQLSIRPDLLPPVVLAELQKLCGSVEPIADSVALEVLRAELGFETVEQIGETFENLHLVASASLVRKQHLISIHNTIYFNCVPIYS